MKFEDIKKLHQRKYREEFGCFLLEGEHLVQELQKAAARDPRLRSSEVYFTREYANWATQLKTHVVNSPHMMQLSETRSPQGIAAVVPLLTAPAAVRGGARSNAPTTPSTEIVAIAPTVPAVSARRASRRQPRRWVTGAGGRGRSDVGCAANSSDG